MSLKGRTRAGGRADRRVVVCVSVLFVCGLGGSAWAAEEAPLDPDLSTKGTRRAGPFHVRPLVLLKDVGYDDNVRFESSTREGDTTATGGIGVDAIVLGGDRGGVRLFQEFDYVAFSRNADLNHWNSASRARGVFLMKRVAVSLEDRLDSVEERPNSEVDQRVRRKRNAITAAVRSLGTGRLGFKAFVRHAGLDFSAGDPAFDPGVKRLNRNENALSVIGELRVRPKTTFTLEGGIERFDFDQEDRRDTRSRSIQPGFRFDPSASIQGEVKLGVISLTAPDQPQSDYRGTIGEGRLSTRLGHRARLKGTYERDLEFSTLTTNLYYVSTAWTAAYEQFLTRRLSAELLYGRGLNHYPEEVSLGGTPPVLALRDDDMITTQATIRYRINEQLWMNLSASRLRRDSTIDTYDRDRNFFAFGSAYSF
jgi:hypothetical protein